MPNSINMKTLVSAAMLVLFSATGISGHGYLQSPRSRNFVAYEDGKDWSPTAEDPEKETCPHCLNLGGPLARCGLVEGRNYDTPRNGIGGPIAAHPQATYHEGQDIVLDVVLPAHHKGHFVYKACPVTEGQVADQTCFDANPLEFVEDLLYGAPKDVNFPYRAYIAPTTNTNAVTDNSGVYGMKFSHKFRLPEGLTGDLVLIQWHYMTANSCEYDGYDTYPFPDPSWRNLNVGPCGPIPADGNGVPEQFWNCAEVTIEPSGTPTSPTPVASPTPAPPSSNASPTMSPNTPPVASPTPVPPVSTGTSNNCCPTGYDGLRAFDSCASFYHCVSGVVTGGPIDCPPGQLFDQSLQRCEFEEQVTCEADSCSSGISTPTVAPAPTHPVPTPTMPTPTPPTPPSMAGDDSRLIAYVGNWQSCPTAEQVEKYTHIVIAFAVSYTWNPTKNVCSETCEISAPPICNNAANPSLIQEWKAAGKKVILSFGGAGMGGSWAGDVNDCWEYCFGRETQVVSQLTDIVNELDLDGVDIDYEYFYEDNQNGSGFSKGAEAQKFLTDVTVGLRQSLPTGSIVTHAPMDPDLVPGNAYYDILVNTASSLDFLMPQYYNGHTRPVIDGIGGTGAGSTSALAHYTNLVENMFSGDATKIVFGFCISDCGGTGSNASGSQAAVVMEDLGTYFGCNGGAFFWVAEHDTNGSWSRSVSNVIQQNAGCSISPTHPTTPSSTSAPTVTSTPPPSEAAPTPSPTSTTSPTPVPTAATIPLPTPASTSAPTDAGDHPMCCPAGYTGLRACNSCTKFYHCEDGAVVGPPSDCHAGLRFDESLQQCNWASDVTCQPDHSCSSQTPSSTAARCGSSYSDAANSCGDACTNDLDCAPSEYCWADVNCNQQRLLRGRA